MDKHSIDNMVDKKIESDLLSGVSVCDIQSDLLIRIQNFKKTISKDCSDFYELYNKKFEEITNIRHRYGISYIKQCEKRFGDLNWLLEKKRVFKGYKNYEIFKIIKFKEKLERNKLPF